MTYPTIALTSDQSRVLFNPTSHKAVHLACILDGDLIWTNLFRGISQSLKAVKKLGEEYADSVETFPSIYSDRHAYMKLIAILQSDVFLELYKGPQKEVKEMVNTLKNILESVAPSNQRAEIDLREDLLNKKFTVGYV